MKFLQFCINHATDDTISPDPGSLGYPEALNKPVESLVKFMKPKMDILDRINIPYIEKELSRDVNELREELEKSCGGIVPDGLINAMSENLYSKTYDELSKSEQAIIKVTSVYLMIQI